MTKSPTPSQLPTATGESERYRVLSLGRALDLLELVATHGHEGARLTDLALDQGLSKAATYAILQTMLAREFVADTGKRANRRYRLGLGLARLGDLAVANIALAEIALPVLRDLTAEVALTSRVAILVEGYAVVVGRVDAPGAVRFESALGRREFPHCSAVGKALLAARPTEEAKFMMRKVGLPRRTSKTITRLSALMKELAETSRRGYAVDDEEDNEGVACIGACIFDRTGQAAGAISVTGLKARDWQVRQEALAKDVMRFAERISLQLGGPSRVEARSRR